jgi:hypothetical protein
VDKAYQKFRNLHSRKNERMTVLEKAARNSYRVLSGKLTVDEVLYLHRDEFIPFIHDPDEEVTDHIVTRVIHALEQFEYYECCEILKRIKNEVQGLSGRNNKERVRHVADKWVSVPIDGSEDWQDIDKSRDLPIYWSEEGAIPHKEKGSLINLQRLRRFVSRLFNSNN